MNKFEYVRNGNGSINVSSTIEAFTSFITAEEQNERTELAAIESAVDAVFESKNDERVTMPVLKVLVCEALGVKGPTYENKVADFIRNNNRFEIGKGKGIGGVKRVRKNA